MELADDLIIFSIDTSIVVGVSTIKILIIVETSLTATSKIRISKITENIELGNPGYNEDLA